MRQTLIDDFWGLHKNMRCAIPLKTRTAMNAKISVFVICVEAIIYLLLYNLHDCTFKIKRINIHFFSKENMAFSILKKYVVYQAV